MGVKPFGVVFINKSSVLPVYVARESLSCLLDNLAPACVETWRESNYVDTICFGSFSLGGANASSVNSVQLLPTSILGGVLSLDPKRHAEPELSVVTKIEMNTNLPVTNFVL